MKILFSFLFGNLNPKDFVRALILAMVAPFLLALQQWADDVKNGVEYHVDWRLTLMASIAVGVGYIIKQMIGFSSRSSDGK